MMGIIKSARELALQRAVELTGNIDQETGAYENEQYIKAAAILAGSYLKGAINLERLAESITGYPPEAAPAAKKMLLKEITSCLNLSNCEQVIEVYQAFKAECKDPAAVEALRALHQDYTNRLSALHSAHELGKALEFLKKKGISGSAIAGINLDLSPQWQESKSALSKEFGNRLQEIKQKLIEPYGFESYGHSSR